MRNILRREVLSRLSRLLRVHFAWSISPEVLSLKLFLLATNAFNADKPTPDYGKSFIKTGRLPNAANRALT